MKLGAWFEQTFGIKRDPSTSWPKRFDVSGPAGALHPAFTRRTVIETQFRDGTHVITVDGVNYPIGRLSEKPELQSRQLMNALAGIAEKLA